MAAASAATVTGGGSPALARIWSISAGWVSKVAVTWIRGAETVIRLVTSFLTEAGAAWPETGWMSIASVVPTTRLGHP